MNFEIFRRKKSPGPFAGLEMERKSEEAVEDDVQVFSLPDWIGHGPFPGQGTTGSEPGLKCSGDGEECLRPRGPWALSGIF